jgi:hypothetical protein
MNFMFQRVWTYTSSGSDLAVVKQIQYYNHLYGWREVHDEELQNLYSSSSKIRMIKSRRMRWAGNVV